MQSCDAVLTMRLIKYTDLINPGQRATSEAAPSTKMFYLLIYLALPQG